jgi:CubicO group peptidase (beta-lactamase class C family)
MSDRWAPLSQLLEEGLTQGVFTAAVALVGLKGEKLWEAARGRVSMEPGAAAATLATVFDLASLTKPLATALALLSLVARGQLSLAASLGEVLPGAWLPPDKQPLKLASLLTHRGGLPAWRPFYADLLKAPPEKRPGLLARLAAAAPLEQAPDTATLYSDLGFMLLQAAAEALSGVRLDAFCREELYLPLGLANLGFNPLSTKNRHPQTPNRLYAATEAGLIPGRPIFGEVHDENAWAAGGVAGHSGLFGSGPEVFSLLAALYRAFAGEAAGPLKPETLRRQAGPGLRHPGAGGGPVLLRPLFFAPKCRPPGLHRHLFLAGPGARPDGSLTDQPGAPGPGRSHQNPGLPPPLPRGGLPGLGVYRKFQVAWERRRLNDL